MARKQTKGAIDQATVNFSVFENLNEYLGIASVTLPSLSWLTQQMSGSGLGGNIEAVLCGMVDAMTLTMNFRQFNDQALSLCSPEMHNITLRVAQQQESPIKGAVQIQGVKHTLRVMPKSLSGGNIAPASTADPSGEYAVRYWKAVVDNKVWIEIDPINFICIIDGVDYLAEVRKALGK